MVDGDREQIDHGAGEQTTPVPAEPTGVPGGRPRSMPQWPA